MGDEGTSLRQRLLQSYAQYQRHEALLSEHFLQCLSQYSNITLYGINAQSRLQERTPTFAIRIDGVTPGDVAVHLGKQNMCVWNGHFYAQGLCEQLGVIDDGGVIRIGLMHYNTVEEIDQLFNALDPFLQRQ